MSNQIKPEKLMEGDILLYHNNRRSWLSKAIRRFDRSYFNHSSLYIENESVIEAIGSGVVKANIIKSSNGQSIYVRRLYNRPTNMAPVTSVGQGYLGRRYGYEQLLLLVLITSTRRVRKNNILLRFVSKLLEKASIILLKLTRGDRQALICSELVYRSYDEVNPSHNDPYTIYLNRSNSHSMDKSMDTDVFDRESLVSQFYGLNGVAFEKGLSSAPIIEDDNIKAMEKLSDELPEFIDDIESDKELEKLYDEVVESYHEEDYTNSSSELEMCKKNMDIFIAAYSKSTSTQKSFKSLSNSGNILNKFIHENANFVTPGDLSRALNLLDLGKLDK